MRKCAPTHSQVVCSSVLDIMLCFSSLAPVDETTTDIICIKCKRDDSDSPNEIVLCDTCGIGKMCLRATRAHMHTAYSTICTPVGKSTPFSGLRGVVHIPTCTHGDMLFFVTLHVCQCEP